MKPLKHTALLYSLVVLTAGGLSSCSDMDDYKKYLPDGEIRYVGKADSLRLHSGKGRILLSWLLIGDPNVNKCKVYWDNRADSVEVTVQRTSAVDTVFLMLDDMQEKTYNFEIYTYDHEGNRSVGVFKNGNVYGEKYQASLLPRVATEAWFEDGSGILKWSVADDQVVGVELEYTSVSGDLNRQLIPPVDTQSTLASFKEGTAFKYRTLFLPDSLAIDTFYTPFESMELVYE